MNAPINQLSHITYRICNIFILYHIECEMITITYNTCKTFYKNSIFLLYSQISKKVSYFFDQSMH